MTGEADMTRAVVRATDALQLALLAAEGGGDASVSGVAEQMLLGDVGDLMTSTQPAMDAQIDAMAEAVRSVVRLVLEHAAVRMTARSVLEVELLRRLSEATGQAPSAILSDIARAVGGDPHG